MDSGGEAYARLTAKARQAKNKNIFFTTNILSFKIPSFPNFFKNYTMKKKGDLKIKI